MDRDKPFVALTRRRLPCPATAKRPASSKANWHCGKASSTSAGFGWPAIATAAPVKVSLVWGDGQDQRQTITIDAIAADYAKTPLQFTAGADTDAGRLEITAAGSGSFHVGTVSLMPADNVQGMRADTLELLKQLDAPVYRWPGGNFVSGYNWRDGIGDPDRRPPRKNPAWQGIEHNDFGIDEFMAFCRLLKTEPYISRQQRIGRQPQRRRGNRVCQRPGRSPRRPIAGEKRPSRTLRRALVEHRQRDVRRLATRLHGAGKVHSETQPVRQGDAGGRSFDQAGRRRRRRSLERGNAAEVRRQHGPDERAFLLRREAKDLVAHVREIPDEIRRIANAHRDYRKRLDSLRGKDIRIAMDEWNYWYGAEPYGQIGCPFHLKDALGIAAGLHEYARQSDIVFMANYAQTVNVIGCIKTSKTAACFDTTGLVLKLYRQHFGVIPVDGRGPPAGAAGRGRRLDRRSQGVYDRHRQSDDEAGRAQT